MEKINVFTTLATPGGDCIGTSGIIVVIYLLEPLNADIIPLLDGWVTEQADHLPLLGTEVVAVGVKGGSISLHRHGGGHHARLVY